MLSASSRMYSRCSLPFEDVPAQPVDGDALLVHHVVVLEEVFADGEVLSFDLLLRSLDGVA